MWQGIFQTISGVWVEGLFGGGRGNLGIEAGRALLTINAVCRETCPYCGAPPDRWVSNGKRPRWFYRVQGSLVTPERGTVQTRKCRTCNRSFTEYPTFAVPFRRYARETIEQICAKYLDDARASYRSVVREGSVPIPYPEDGRFRSRRPAAEDDGDLDAEAPALAHTTPYRWIAAMAAAPGSRALTAPQGALDAPDIPPRKYRSYARKRELVRCAEALRSRGKRS